MKKLLRITLLILLSVQAGKMEGYIFSGYGLLENEYWKELPLEVQSNVKDSIFFLISAKTNLEGGGGSKDCTKSALQMNPIKFVSTLNEWVNVINNPLSPIPPYAERYTFSSDSVLWIDKYYFRQLVNNSPFGNDFVQNGRIFREENGKVYEALDVAPGEFLIYDFSLSVGDTTEVLLGPIKTELICTKVDTVVFLDGNARKRLEMQCLSQDKKYIWIEGFGEPYLYYNYCEVENESGYVACYYYNNSLSYKNAISNECWVVSTADVEQNELSILPNPTIDLVNILCKSKIDQINVYNIIGNLIKSNKDNTVIDFSELQNGIYILEITSNNKKLTRRVVKM